MFLDIFFCDIHLNYSLCALWLSFSYIISFRGCHLTHCLFSLSTWTFSGQEDKKLPPPLPKKPAGGVSGSLRSDSTGDGGAGSGGGGSGGLVVPRLGGHTLPIREKSLDLGDRQRTEARRRLLQTKRAASFRQNSATESADSIEIYIPEAQTRLWTQDRRVSFSSTHTSPSLSLSLDWDFLWVTTVYPPPPCKHLHLFTNINSKLTLFAHKTSHFSFLKVWHLPAPGA